MSCVCAADVVKLETGTFRIAFRDEHGNAILQDQSFRTAVKAGMALTSHGQKGESLSKNAHEFQGEWIDEGPRDGTGGTYQMSYSPATTVRAASDAETTAASAAPLRMLMLTNLSEWQC